MMNTQQHLQDIEAFYQLLQRLDQKVGGKRRLVDCTGRDEWPQRGVYFFFEKGEIRHSGSELRVVRVGTHAINSTSATTLWSRLSQHRGPQHGVGNHRGSVFRLHVGKALIMQQSDKITLPTWGVGSSADKATRLSEADHERRVSMIIGQMPFLWLSIEDAPGSESGRAYIERNAIALLTGPDGRSPVDPPSTGWLGNYSAIQKIRTSGLWNVNFVGDPGKPSNYDSMFLTRLAGYIDSMTSSDTRKYQLL